MTGIYIHICFVFSSVYLKCKNPFEVASHSAIPDSRSDSFQSLFSKLNTLHLIFLSFGQEMAAHLFALAPPFAVLLQFVL